MELFSVKQPISREKNQELVINVKEDGCYALELVASAPTSWQEKNNESVMVRLYLNGSHHQDIILFYGVHVFSYRRLLGELAAGSYTLTCEFFSPVAETPTAAWIEEVKIEKLTLGYHDRLAARFSPKLYGRSVYSSYDNLYTDTPLEMIYFIEEWERGKVIEYHMVFSHEDEGTPAVMLMAKWGRLLDIEYMARVYLTEDLTVDHVEYQGAGHVNSNYGQPLFDSHRPVLQTATCNGNFTDEITSDYCFFFLPGYEWKRREEAREIVMEKFPYINHVMDWEAQRQLSSTAQPAYNRIEDVQQYLFIQSSVWKVELGQPTIDFTFQFTGDERCYSSSFDKLQAGPFLAAYTGPYHHFGTAVLLPENKQFSDIEKISVRLIGEKVDHVKIKDLKVLSYDRNKGMVMHLDEKLVCELNQSAKHELIWTAARGVTKDASIV